MTIPLGGWDPVVTAINMDRWNALPEPLQALIAKDVAEKFEAPAWAAAAGALEGDIACLTGKGDCAAGKPASMKLVEPSDADVAEARKILTEVVLPEWAERAGKDWAQRWNDSVGKTVGVTVPLN
jgi:TRAP-type C4-dicarboxylate transport system substrate-binding protein